MIAQNSGLIEGNVFMPNFINTSSSPWTLLGRPVFFSEKMSAIGDQGDIAFCDFSQYAIGVRSEIRFEISRDFLFQTDELASRCILRADGMPLWDEAMTLRDGVTTVSPFVTLASR